MKYGFWAVVLLILISNSFGYAEMYIWVDENGVKHFTDRPPESGTVSTEHVKQVETPKYVFNHRLYRKQGDQELCGDYRLPVENDGNSKLLLLNALYAHKKARKDRRRLQEELRTATNEKQRQHLREYIDEHECVMEWAKSVTAELEDVQLQIIKEARLAQKEYDEVQNRCGEEPSPGWHNDLEAKEWVECKSRVRKLHNKLLRKLKEKISMEEDLKRALGED